MDVLTIAIGGERFGLDLGAVVELLRAVAIRRVPGAPAVIEGVVDVRGELVPCFDLRARFGMPPKELHHAEHLVVASDGARRVALRADQVLGIVRLDSGDVLPGAVAAPGLSALAGVGRLDDGLVLIQDLRAFLTQAEAQALAAALGAEAP